MTSICNHAGLGQTAPVSYTATSVLEAMKVLSNMQVHEPRLREWFSRSPFAEKYIE